MLKRIRRWLKRRADENAADECGDGWRRRDDYKRLVYTGETPPWYDGFWQRRDPEYWTDERWLAYLIDEAARRGEVWRIPPAVYMGLEKMGQVDDKQPKDERADPSSD